MSLGVQNFGVFIYVPFWVRTIFIISRLAFCAGKNKIINRYQAEPAAFPHIMHASHSYRDAWDQHCEGIYIYNIWNVSKVADYTY